MVLAWWGVAWAGDVPGSILRASDRLELGVEHLVASPDGEHVLMFSSEKVVVLGPKGDPLATLPLTNIQFADVCGSGRFALVHAGGVTVHSDAGREIGRLAAFGKVHDIALSGDGRFLALATTLSSSVYDAVDGRTLWSTDGEATGVGYDSAGKLFVERGGAVVQVDPMSGAKRGPGAMPGLAGYVADGCLHLQDGPFCPSGPGTIGVQRTDGTLWLLHGGVLERWHPIPEDGVSPIGADGGSAIVALAWMGTDSVLISRIDGHLERRGLDGEVMVDVVIPNCDPCDPMVIGGDANGMYAVGQNGSWMTWDVAGTPTQNVAKVAAVVAAQRLPDGRWVSLSPEGKARVGSAPGKGPATKALVGAVGVAAAGDSIAVWSDTKLRLFSADRKPLPTPDVGAGRKPVAVELAPDGGIVAVLDSGGALHAYRTRDGRAVFRVMADVVGTHLAWAPGSGFILAGGDPLRVFSASDGREILQVRMAPDGAVERLATGPDGSILLAHTNQTRQVLRRIPWSSIAP